MARSYPITLTLQITKLGKEGTTEEGYWSGENGASGVLPIARDTGRICLAWRNKEVHQGDCFGTTGGAIKDGMKPSDSARSEMQEEVGYSGEVELHPAWVFESEDGFRYFNFIGVVPSEFPFEPEEKHAWETDYIEWMSLEEILTGMEDSPADYHPELITLFEESRDLIVQLSGKLKTASTYPNQLRSAVRLMKIQMLAMPNEYETSTETALDMQEEVGGIVMGYNHEDNPTALLGENEGGHDFLVVEDRYILDAWVGEYYRLQDLYDLSDPKDEERVLKLYGPKQFWRPLPGMEKASSHKMTPLQDPPDYVEGTNGWALHPDQRATG